MLAQIFRFFFSLGFLGALVAGFSVFNLIVRVSEFGVSNTIDEFLIFFRTLISWFFSWTLYLGFEVPWWYRDLIAMSSVGSGVILRGADWDEEYENKGYGFHPEKIPLFGLIFVTVVVTALLIGLAGIVAGAMFLVSAQTDEARSVRKEFLTSLAVVGFLFAANAYGLSGAIEGR